MTQTADQAGPTPDLTKRGTMPIVTVQQPIKIVRKLSPLEPSHPTQNKVVAPGHLNTGPLVTVVSVQAKALTAIRDLAGRAEHAGRLGAMTGTLTRTTDGKGYLISFANGEVLWRADRGALAVYGDIGRHWHKLGAMHGFLGWPRSSEADTVATRDGRSGLSARPGWRSRSWRRLR
jgi:hypothetical protein